MLHFVTSSCILIVDEGNMVVVVSYLVKRFWNDIRYERAPSHFHSDVSKF